VSDFAVNFDTYYHSTVPDVTSLHKAQASLKLATAMLSSWFGQKSNDAEQRRTSEPSRAPSRPSGSTTADPRLSLDKSGSRHSFTAYTTPHDTILADLQRRNRSPESAFGSHTPPDANVEEKPPSQVELSQSPTSNVNIATPKPAAQAVDLLFDPFDGTPHGVLLPRESNGHEESPRRVESESITTAADEVVWSHLSRVLKLQSQIANMHVKMEGISLGKPGDSKKGQGQGQPLGGLGGTTDVEDDKKVYSAALGTRPRAISNVSTIGTEREPEGDEEGVSVGDEEAQKNRAREEEFAKLADQFEGKKDSINEIMNKVCLRTGCLSKLMFYFHACVQLADLSKALTEFHTLQPSSDQFPGSRNNSMGTTSPIGATVGDILDKTPLKQTSAPENLVPPMANSMEASAANLPASLSRVVTPPAQSQGPVRPTLLINSLEKAQVMDSPASTLGSLKLPPEDS